MLSAEELEAEYYRRLEAQKLDQERRRFADSDRDVDLERVWVAYVWVQRDKDNPSIGEWKLGGFRRRRNLRRTQTMGRFFAKIRRKLGIDKKAPVTLVDLGAALRRTTGDQAWRFRPPQFQVRKPRLIMPKGPVIDRRKRKTRARQKAFIFNPKTTKYIVLGRNVLDKRKPGYLYLGPLKSAMKRQAQFEAKRLFRGAWSDLLVVGTQELSKPLRAALVRNRRVRAGVTRIMWPEVPPSFDKMWDKFAKRLVREEFFDAIAVDDPGMLDTRDELRTMWQEQGSPWLTLKWFQQQINLWSGQWVKVRGTLPRVRRLNGSVRRVRVVKGTVARVTTNSSRRK